MFDELIRFLPPSEGGHEEWGRSEAPTPTDLILRGWGQRVGASEGAAASWASGGAAQAGV